MEKKYENGGQKIVLLKNQSFLKNFQEDVDYNIGGKQLSYPKLNFFFRFFPIVCTLLHIRSITIILSYRVVMDRIKKLHFWVLPRISQKKPLQANFNHIFALQKNK